MSSGYLEQLLAFLFSPLGLTVAIFGVFFVQQARRSSRMAWLLFSLCCFTASLSAYTDEWITQAPALVFPLEQMRALGRPLTMVLLVLLLLVVWQPLPTWRRRLLPEPIRYILVLQAVIILKTLLYGSITFALLTLVTIGSVTFMIYLGPSRWLKSDQDFRLATWAVVMVGVIFSVINIYQALFDPYPITFVQGRFLGTTGNPQHAATLLAAILPCLMFMVEETQQQRKLQIVWGSLLAVVLFGLYLTGSHAGMIMGLTAIILFYGHRLNRLVNVGIVISACLLVLVIIFDQTGAIWEMLGGLLQERYTSLENSRETVWRALWRNFQTYPFFGVPLQGDRFSGYGESSWLGTASATGLMGLIPLSLFGISTLHLMFKVWHLGRQYHNYFFYSSTVIAGLASLLVGSIFEAYLLGNLGVNVFLLLLYIVMAQYLVDVHQVLASSTFPIRVRRYQRMQRVAGASTTTSGLQELVS